MNSIAEQRVRDLCASTAGARRRPGYAFRVLVISPKKIDQILEEIAFQLETTRTRSSPANALDLAEAEKAGLALRDDRPPAHHGKIASHAMILGVRQVLGLPQPLGDVLRDWTRPNGIRITKVRVPIGVIAIIYESRPNVTVDAAVLCLKTGNATVLRGGKEAIHSNRALIASMQKVQVAARAPSARARHRPRARPLSSAARRNSSTSSSRAAATA